MSCSGVHASGSGIGWSPTAPHLKPRLECFTQIAASLTGARGSGQTARKALLLEGQLTQISRVRNRAVVASPLGDNLMAREFEGWGTRGTRIRELQRGRWANPRFDQPRLEMQCCPQPTSIQRRECQWDPTYKCLHLFRSSEALQVQWCDAYSHKSTKPPN